MSLPQTGERFTGMRKPGVPIIALVACPRCLGSGRVPLGEDIRAARKRRGLTASLVARRMGISPQYLSDLEHDRRAWTGNLWARWQSVLAQAP